MKILIAMVALATLIAVPALSATRDAPPSSVIFNGKVIGTDPEAHIRSMLQKDWEYQGRPRPWIGD